MTRTHYMEPQMQPVKFFAATDVVVIDINPEMADYDNPRGEILGHAAYVYAEDAQGYRRRLFVATHPIDEQALAPAQRMAAALGRRLEAGALPVVFDRWQEARPAYGTAAYEAEGQWADLEWERLEAAEY